MALRDRLRHLEAAHELVKTHAAAQKAELVVQLQLDNELLKGLVRTLTLTNEDQKACLLRAEQKIVAIKKQNDGLANKLMASRRRVFKLEQERREQKALLQGLTDIKTLVKGNTNALQSLDKRVNFT
ncbi:hypothetical protein P171DRAFT_480336 [Karstenula rhodostoma CBS 690.94]|uniref:Uncharacterized protein n=1 Tax=Karstenula rhodostoma CBS 690.94 TaxID=1392251 RepID=A0A9P4PTU5_9PLEO|nr:hypothetical protein P171DRAFT_480336 [Karstenula rhodostoma CBS 690.94]